MHVLNAALAFPVPKSAEVQIEELGLINWVAVKEFNLSDYSGETRVNTIYAH